MDRPTGLLIDIDGVLTVSWEAIAGAVDALAGLRHLGVPVRFLTNTTSKSREDVGEALLKAGFGVVADEIITAPVATASYLRRMHPGARCLVINEGDLSADLDGVEIVARGPVDVVVIGGAGPVFSYGSLNRAFAALSSGAALVAMHRNLVWRTDRGLQLDSGGFVSALERAAGVDAVVVGKPSPEFFRTGLGSLALDAPAVAMVGDDLANDVLAAQAVGLTGIQVRTGKFDPAQLERGAPDLILDSFADILSIF